MEDIKFLIDAVLFEIDKNEDEAFAAISLNPAVTWAKFILTDDLPNANKQRIPLDEFDNIIKTGIFMPIKMAYGAISDGHPDTYPLGVISHLKKVKNQIHGLAALWERERPEDVKLIKERYADGKPLQLSWEMLYANSSIENGVTDLRDLALKAVTLVGEPAYEGRTPITAVASTDSNLEVDKLEKEEYETKIAELEAAVTAKETELVSLREFKATVDKEKADAEKLASIRAKFVSAKIEKDEAYFTENREKLLSLEPEVLDFMLQEMVSFSSTHRTETESTSSVTIPPITSGGDRVTKQELVNYLKSRVSKKE